MKLSKHKFLVRKAGTKERYFMRREQTSRECWGGVSFVRERGGGWGRDEAVNVSHTAICSSLLAC